jgi:hypothetical protein
MSRIRFTKVATPSAPAADKVEVFVATADRRVKQIDEFGNVSSLSNDGWKDKNIIINGDFGIAQRQVVTTLTSYAANTNRTYGPDRWGQSVQTSSCQFAAIDTNTSPETNMLSRYYGKWIQITGAGKLVLSHVVESNNFMHTWGQLVRFQVKMRYSAGAGITMRLGLMQLTSSGTVDTVTNAGFISAYGSNGTDPTFPANHTLLTPVIAEGGTISGSGVTCVLTSGWVRYSATFVVPSGCKNIIPMLWSNSQLLVNDALCVGEAGLYYGSEIRDWTPKAEALELMNCQRYYFKTFNLLTAPAFQVLPGTVRWSLGVAGAVSATWGEIKYPVRMRSATGTVAWYSPVTAASAFPYMFSATAGPCTAVAVANQHDGGFSVTTTPPATGVIGGNVGVQVTVDNEL